MNKTVLIVDDASLIRSVAQRAAEGIGVNVITASDGEEGLLKLESNNIDIVFSDVNMPKMDGLTMVSEIKKQDKYKFLPIVMLTTESSIELKNKGKSLGVKAWLVKPFNKEKFVLALEKLLS
jgi:two-component system chemotaxis response regulator CheY